MAQVEVTATGLIIHVMGWDKLWALRSQLEIPLAHLVDSEIAGDSALIAWKGWRNGGTHVPGVITAGTYYKDGERTFWDVHPGPGHRDPSGSRAVCQAHDRSRESGGDRRGHPAGPRFAGRVGHRVEQ